MRQEKLIGLLMVILILRLLGSVLISATPAGAAETSVATVTASLVPPTRASNDPSPATTLATASTGPGSAAVASAISVKAYGAVGNGTANDTAAIQRALRTGAAVVTIPDGVYLVDAVIGLKPLSNQSILLSANATLKAMPNAAGFYNVIRLESVSNVEIAGGRLTGERHAHLGASGEHGMGILIGKNTDNIRIRNIAISDCWGDGIYIGSDASGIARNILIENVICENNRRQGLSITHAEYVTVRDSIFRNTNGIAPQAGLDIEPNNGGHVNNVTIKGCQFINNAGFGVIINGADSQYVRTVSIDSNSFSGNVIGITNARNTTDISLIIPAGTARIKSNEYAQCYGLDQVTIPNSVTEIGNGAFQSNFDLASISIPDSVTTIGREAFKNCRSLTSVNIPASVTSLGDYAFTGCFNLRSAYFFGNDPVASSHVFDSAAFDFKVYFIAGASGFSTPNWRGYLSATFVP